jgi:hypothetical protein
MLTQSQENPKKNQRKKAKAQLRLGTYYLLVSPTTAINSSATEFSNVGANFAPNLQSLRFLPNRFLLCQSSRVPDLKLWYVLLGLRFPLHWSENPSISVLDSRTAFATLILSQRFRFDKLV